MNKKEETVEHIREFNRFYTVLVGSLNTHFLGSKYSITETRILFELLSHKKCYAKDIVEYLHIDKSYMSRIIKSFEKNGLIIKEMSQFDHRAFLITLTDKGQMETNMLIEKTNQQIHEWIDGLNLQECQEICSAMNTIKHYLSNDERKMKNE